MVAGKGSSAEASDSFATERFDPAAFSTADEKFSVLPCPAKVPRDISEGMRMACWFKDWSAWFVGTVVEVNKQRTVTDNGIERSESNSH